MLIWYNVMVPKNPNSLYNPITMRSRLLAGTVGAVLLAGSCSGPEQHPQQTIDANEPAELQSKYQQTHIASSEGEVVVEYTFVVEQCEAESTDPDDCVTAAVEVNESTYNAFNPGDEILFMQDMSGPSVTGVANQQIS